VKDIMDYRNFKNISGIYKITSCIDNKSYIGSAKLIRNRINRHQNNLINNCHHSLHLQNAFNLYGIDNFIVEILEYCESSNVILIEREQYFLDLYKPWVSEYGYNTCEIAGSPEHRKLSKEHKEKIGKSLLNHLVSDDTKKKIGDGNRNKKMSSESIELNRKWHTGIKQSEESILNRARKYSFIDSNGIIYIGHNLKRFCDEHKLYRQNMKMVLTGKRNSHHGFKYYKET
jgi:group I intron endonuclease